MPSSNNSEVTRPCENSNNVHNSSKNDANRLNKLENEVSRLRDEVDKIKWQRAAAETAIERAIVRGAAALGGRYKVLVPVEYTSTKKQDRRELKNNTNGWSNESIASDDSGSSKKNTDKLVACEAAGSTADNNVKVKKVGADCGQYTFG